MKNIEPTTHDITVTPSRDDSKLSDLYLVNQQLVAENQQQRDAADDAQGPNSPLSVRAVFDREKAAAIAAVAAGSLIAPFLLLSLMLFPNSNNPGNVLSSASAVFMIAMIVILLMNTIYRMVADFCKIADMNIGLVFAALIGLAVPIIYYSIFLFLMSGNFFMMLLVGVVFWAMYYMLLYGLYHLVHRRP